MKILRLPLDIVNDCLNDCLQKSKKPKQKNHVPEFFNKFKFSYFPSLCSTIKSFKIPFKSGLPTSSKS